MDLSEELFLSGHTSCAGCACAIAMRHILHALGREAVVINATGCMEIVSTNYPQNTWGVPYLHSVFENTAAVASGVSRAFKKLGKKGVVTVIGGDGSTYDIGFGGISAAMERNEDILYICYDNEAYANTGLQRSGGTPFAAATTTTPKEVGGKHEWKKDLAFIAAAHGIPYVATASIAYPDDLKQKLLKAKVMKGFRFIVLFAPCTYGWKIPTNMPIKVSENAVESGMWNLFEVENGRFKRSYKPKMIPVKQYLAGQKRFSHVTEEQLKIMQVHVERVQEELDKLEKSEIDFRYLV
ncbi:MAG: thiamine pyrophosphate-dependent enzyme [Candidatus Micrarchaeota archaeon]